VACSWAGWSLPCLGRCCSAWAGAWSSGSLPWRLPPCPFPSARGAATPSGRPRSRRRAGPGLFRAAHHRLVCRSHLPHHGRNPGRPGDRARYAVADLAVGRFRLAGGTGSGSGMALQYILSGVGWIVIIAAVSFIPVIRNVEDLLPDHQQSPRPSRPRPSPWVVLCAARYSPMKCHEVTVERTARGMQSEAYLAALLEILACPVDPAIPLTPIRDSSGQVVALRSQNGNTPSSTRASYDPGPAGAHRSKPDSVAGAPGTDVAGLPGWEEKCLFGRRRGDGVYWRDYRPDRRGPVPRCRLWGSAVPGLYGYFGQRCQLDRR